MLTSFILRPDGSVGHDTSVDALREAWRDPATVLWLDMDQPSQEELSLLKTAFEFHPLAIDDAIHTAQRPKIMPFCPHHGADGRSPGPAPAGKPFANEHPEPGAARAAESADEQCVDGYFYMVIHGPDLEAADDGAFRTKELDLFLSATGLVTIHEKRMRSVCEVRDRTKADARLALAEGVDMLLHSILDHIMDHYEPILDKLQEDLNQLEDEAVERPRVELLSRIAARKRDLLMLRRVIAPQREVVAQLARGEAPFIGPRARLYMRDVQDHLARIVEMIEVYRDLVMGARDLYLSSINNNLNQIMKTLTIISVIALPLTVITSFFGMNFPVISAIGTNAVFWWTIAIMAAGVAGLLWLFKRKHWL